MDTSSKKPPFAWQPLTARGVAAFARATLGRLLLVQFVFAMLGAVAVLWFLETAWFPTINEAVLQLPATGEIRSGKLAWGGSSPQRIAENHFLALVVDLKHEGQARSPAHLEVEFGESDFKIFSLLGFMQEPYPRGWIVALNREELLPRWGAWKPAVLAFAAGIVIISSMVIWTVLATVYCPAAWLIAFFSNRELSLAGSWRLAGAALMPGALFLTGAIVVYGLGAADLIRLGMAGAVSLVVGWVYLVLSPQCLPKHAAAEQKTNPFVEKSVH